MSKATHTGTCQCCGNSQKLPSGVLSKHGYTVENGWFNGVCYGAGELPFEQSKDLIEGFIKLAQEKCVELEADIKKWSEETVTVMRHTYHSGSMSERSMYTWDEVEVTAEFKPYDDDSGDGYYNFKWSDGGVGRGFRSEYANTYGEINTVEEAVKYLNKAWVKRFQKQLAATQQYVEWQQNRIQNWKPTELTPIK